MAARPDTIGACAANPAERVRLLLAVLDGTGPMRFVVPLFFTAHL